MSLLNSIDRDHVFTAIETWDSVNGSVYFQVKGEASTHVLLHAGREYDAPAIAGIAHGLATGRTLSPDDIPGGAPAAAKALTRLGFEIRDDSPVSAAPTRTARPRKTTGSTSGTTRRSTAIGTPRSPRVAASDKPVNVCPTCYMAIPATGICDNCG